MDKDPSEIAKLTERISKDPKSRLFVPLAEEYKKAGDIDMAVHVLSEGLKNNPTYVTARSILGKLLIEQGDLVDARKEFEEVVKAIPDNLMAQRKLGDIYAFENKPAEALKHYRAVLAINPKDTETAMLIAEMEAGRDIKKLIPGPKATTTAVSNEPATRQQTPTTAAGSAAAKPSLPVVLSVTSDLPGATASHEEEAEEVLTVVPLGPEDLETPAAAAREASAGAFDFLAETPSSLESGAAEGEAFSAPLDLDQGGPFAPDEAAAPAFEAAGAGLGQQAVFVDEPVAAADSMEPFALAEESSPVLEEPAPALEFGAPFAVHEGGVQNEEVQPAGLSETFNEPEQAAPPLEEMFPAAELVEPLPEDGQLISAAEEPIDAFLMEEPAEAVAPVAAEEAEHSLFAESEVFAGESPALGAETPVETAGSDIITAELVEESEKQADDFTTDTLAELYISQGFFEKAIDIYERMVADHPNSEGLKEKLVHVRSMAAAAEQNAEPASSIDIDAEGDAGGEPRSETEPGEDVFVPATAASAQPRLDDWEVPASKAAPASTDAGEPRPVRQARPFDVGFEPREYVPPDALLRKSERDEGKSVAAGKHVVAPTSAPGEPGEPVNRKETVERLESWLKNIIKET